MTWNQIIIDVATDHVWAISQFSDADVRDASLSFTPDGHCILAVAGSYESGRCILLRLDHDSRAMPGVSLVILMKQR